MLDQKTCYVGWWVANMVTKIDRIIFQPNRYVYTAQNDCFACTKNEMK